MPLLVACFCSEWLEFLVPINLSVKIYGMRFKNYRWDIIIDVDNILNYSFDVNSYEWPTETLKTSVSSCSLCSIYKRTCFRALIQLTFQLNEKWINRSLTKEDVGHVLHLPHVWPPQLEMLESGGLMRCFHWEHCHLLSWDQWTGYLPQPRAIGLSWNWDIFAETKRHTSK